MTVLFVMLDGLRPDAITPERTPTLTGFMARGAYTLGGRSVEPSITLPCHTSIFHSVPPSRHGIVENVWHPMARPVTGLVEHLRAHEKRTAFFHNWDTLRDVTRPGALSYHFFNDSGYDLDGDEILAEMALPIVREARFDLTWVYFASIDVSGHAFGWMSADYLAQVHRVDALLGDLLAVVPEGMRVIIHSDHGGHERTHGTTMPEDMTIPYMLAGEGIRQGYSMSEAVSLLDTAPTIAHLLGITPHSDWEGRALEEAFLTEKTDY